MEKLKDELLDKISKYENGEIKKDYLIKWAKNVMNNLLETKKIMFLDNVSIYPFLKNLYSETDVFGSFDDKLVEDIKDVITGNKDISFSCFLNIPDELENEDINKLNKIILDCNRYNELLKEDVEILNELKGVYEDKINETIIDILVKSSLDLITYLPKEKEEGDKNGFTDFDKDKFINTLLRTNVLMDYLNGRENFFVSVFYESGNYKLLLV